MKDPTLLLSLQAREVDPRFGTLLVVGLGVWFMISGPLLVLWGLHSRRRAARSAAWPTTTGEVINSRVLPLPSRFTTHEVRVTYSYQVRGKEYRSSKVNLMHYAFRGKEQAQRGADRYPAGAKVTVYYDPDRPAEAVLQPGTASSGFSYAALIATGAFAFVVGLYFLLFVR